MAIDRNIFFYLVSTLYMDNMFSALSNILPEKIQSYSQKQNILFDIIFILSEIVKKKKN
jgi:hypothetical protein